MCTPGWPSVSPPHDVLFLLIICKFVSVGLSSLSTRSKIDMLPGCGTHWREIYETESHFGVESEFLKIAKFSVDVFFLNKITGSLRKIIDCNRTTENYPVM